MTSQDEKWLLEEKYNGEKSNAFFADCKRLALGEPLGYLIGHIPFLDTVIHLDSRPLVPRPETEFWTEKAIIEIKKNSKATPRILDLCAGSGCIGIAVAKAISGTEVDFAEVVAKHIDLIKKNLEVNTISSDRTVVYHSGLFSKTSGKYDYILSNPPYIDSQLNRTDESVIDFEPHLALFGGKDGMELISEIIAEAPSHLNPNGQLWIEHEPEQSEVIIELGKEKNFKAITHKDQYGVNRYSILVLQ